MNESERINESDRLCLEIEATRQRIDYKVEDLKSSLTPPSITRVKETLYGGGEKLMDAFRENPVPISLMGAGLGWLIIRDLTSGMRNPSYGRMYGEETAADRIKDKVGDAVDKAKDAVSGAVDKTKGALSGAAHKVGDTVSAGASKVKGVAVRGAQGVSDWFTTTLEENPIVLAAISLGCGVVAGLSIPASKAETDTAGKIGEKIASAVLSKGKEAVDKIEDGGQKSEDGGQKSPEASNQQSPESSDNSHPTYGSLTQKLGDAGL